MLSSNPYESSRPSQDSFSYPSWTLRMACYAIQPFQCAHKHFNAWWIGQVILITWKLFYKHYKKKLFLLSSLNALLGCWKFSILGTQFQVGVYLWINIKSKWSWSGLLCLMSNNCGVFLGSWDTTGVSLNTMLQLLRACATHQFTQEGQFLVDCWTCTSI